MQKENIRSLEIQELTIQRLSLIRERNRILAIVGITLILTLIYGCLKNPFIYTFSKIGNYFGYRGLYIGWGCLVAFTFQYTGIKLFRFSDFPYKWTYIALSSASFFIIITTIIPSIRDKWYFLHVLHKWTTFFYVMSMILAFHTFFIWLARKRKELVPLLRNWQIVILIGSIGSLLIQGQTGIFELWFYLGLGTLLIYLCSYLYNERIKENAQKKATEK